MLTIITLSCAMLLAAPIIVHTPNEDEKPTQNAGHNMTLQAPDVTDTSAQNISLTTIADEEAQKLLEKKATQEELSNPPKDITPPKLALQETSMTSSEGERLTAIVDEHKRKKKDTWLGGIKDAIHNIFYQPEK